MDVKREDVKSEVQQQAETDLYRNVRSILDKLTPQNFQTLIKQVQGLVIDTETKLKDVIDIIYEKAISRPDVSEACAHMCRYMLTLKVPSDTKQGESVHFRVLLLARCQREFEKNKDSHHDLDKRLDTESARHQDEATAETEEAPGRSLGNIRFMGELFKLKMITEKVMHDCVFKLLKTRDEENLECVCLLLTTIGKELESKKSKARIDQYFQQMNGIVAKKKVSPRCRLIVQDVTDLRQNNWMPRNDDSNPKPIDQKDGKKEAEPNLV